MALVSSPHPQIEHLKSQIDRLGLELMEKVHYEEAIKLLNEEVREAKVKLASHDAEEKTRSRELWETRAKLEEKRKECLRERDAAIQLQQQLTVARDALEACQRLQETSRQDRDEQISSLESELAIAVAGRAAAEAETAVTRDLVAVLRGELTAAREVAATAMEVAAERDAQLLAARAVVAEREAELRKQNSAVEGAVTAAEAAAAMAAAGSAERVATLEGRLEEALSSLRRADSEREQQQKELAFYHSESELQLTAQRAQREGLQTRISDLELQCQSQLAQLADHETKVEMQEQQRLCDRVRIEDYERKIEMQEQQQLRDRACIEECERKMEMQEQQQVLERARIEEYCRKIEMQELQHLRDLARIEDCEQQLQVQAQQHLHDLARIEDCEQQLQVQEQQHLHDLARIEDCEQQLQVQEQQHLHHLARIEDSETDRLARAAEAAKTIVRSERELDVTRAEAPAAAAAGGGAGGRDLEDSEADPVEESAEASRTITRLERELEVTRAEAQAAAAASGRAGIGGLEVSKDSETNPAEELAEASRTITRLERELEVTRAEARAAAAAGGRAGVGGVEVYIGDEDSQNRQLLLTLVQLGKDKCSPAINGIIGDEDNQNRQLLLTLVQLKKDCELAELENRSLKDIMSCFDADLQQHAEKIGHLNHKQKIRYTLMLKEQISKLFEELKGARQHILRLQTEKMNESLLDALVSLGVTPLSRPPRSPSGAVSGFISPGTAPKHSSRRRTTLGSSGPSARADIGLDADTRLSEALHTCRQHELALERLNIDFLHLKALVERVVILADGDSAACHTSFAQLLVRLRAAIEGARREGWQGVVDAVDVGVSVP